MPHRRWLQMVVAAMLHGKIIAAFSASVPPVEPHSFFPKPERDSQLNFHKVLQTLGKTCFRPGGTKSTATLHEWAHLTANDTAMELAAGLGTGGMALAAKYGCKVLLTDRDEGRLEQAATVASQNQAIAPLITTRYLDLLHMDLAYTNVDAAIIEASLTHFPAAQKERILSQLQPHTKQLLLHEICLIGEAADSPDLAIAIKQEMGQALQIGFQPETVDEWRRLLSHSGFAAIQIQTGQIQLLNPITLVEDEGITGGLTIAWNLARHPDLRERVLRVRGLLHKHRHSLQYILVQAIPT